MDFKRTFGGYFPVHLDISEHLNFEKRNVIVLADNSNDDSYPLKKTRKIRFYLFWRFTETFGWFHIKSLYITSFEQIRLLVAVFLFILKIFREIC